MGFHASQIHSLFNDSWSGSDLPLADIKTANNAYNQYAIKPDDLKVPYLLCWNHKEQIGFVIPTCSINNKFKIKTSLKHKECELLSVFTTKDLEELKRYYYDHIEGKSHD